MDKEVLFVCLTVFAVFAVVVGCIFRSNERMADCQIAAIAENYTSAEIQVICH